MRSRALPDSTSNAALCRDVTRDLGKRVDEVRTSQKKPKWDDFAQSNQVEKMRIVPCVGDSGCETCEKTEFPRHQRCISSCPSIHEYITKKIKTTFFLQALCVYSA